MTRIVQRSFASGELAPEFYGQSDQDFYRSGAKTLSNVVVTKEGSLRKRSGLEYVSATGGYRLLRFGASDGSDFIVSLGDGGVRIYRDGLEQAITPPAWAAGLYPPYSFVTHGGHTYSNYGVWTDTEPGAEGSAWDTETLPQYPSYSEFAQIKAVQLGDVLTITHKSHEPFQITRGSSGWSFGTPSLAAPLFDIDAFINNGTGISVSLGAEVPTSDDWHFARDWTWIVTAVYQEAGMWRETLSQQAVSLSCCMTPDFRPRRITIPNTGSLARRYRIYRGYNGLYGLVGEVTGDTSGSSYFWDKGENPDTTRQPPGRLGSDALYEASAGAPEGEEVLKPNVAAFWNQRMLLAGFTESPATLLVGGTDSLHDFTQNPMLDPGDADGAELSLAATEHEEIRAIVPAAQLLVLTSRGEWVVQTDGPVTPRSLTARRNSSRGIGDVAPLVVGGHVLFVSRSGAVYALALDSERGEWAQHDLTALSAHLFEGKKVVDWAYQQRPDSVIWCVLDDGTFLSLTYRPEAGIVAWARHATEGGLVGAVAVAEEDNADVVYFSVLRGAVTTLEKIHDVTSPTTIDDGFYLDAADSWDGSGRGFVTVRAVVGVPVADPGNLGEGGNWYRIYDPPAGAVNVVIECTQAGLPGGTAKVKVSTDGGTVWGASTALPTGIVTLLALGAPAETGLSVRAHASYSMEVGDKWTITLAGTEGFQTGEMVEVTTSLTGQLAPVVGETGAQIVVRSGSDSGTVTVAPGLFDDSTTVSGTLAAVLPASLRRPATVGDWDMLTFTAGGFSALSGTVVDALADGVLVEDLTVDGTGFVTLTVPAQRVVVGLPYDATVELLDPPDQKGVPARELTWLGVRCATAGAPALRPDATVTTGGQPEEVSVDGAVTRRTIEGTLAHALEGEVAGAIVQTYPYPLRILWVARDVEFQSDL